VEASLQASLIHTSASLVSPLPLPHRDPFNIAEGRSPCQTTTVPLNGPPLSRDSLQSRPGETPLESPPP